MSDDIDIEEHDVLDNPRIKQMFPQIVSIKTEVEDYEEEINLEDMYTHDGRGRFIFEQGNTMIPFQNKIVIGSEPCTLQNREQSLREAQGTDLPETKFEDASFHETQSPQQILNTSFESSSEQNLEENRSEQESDHWTDPNCNFLKTSLLGKRFQNKIILGSKAISSTHIEDDHSNRNYLPNASVVLEDCKSFLERSPRFCKECKTLFATKNDMDAHNMVAHSYLVAVTKNRAVKSTSRSVASAESRNSLLCSHCDVVFPNTISLLKHSYELLPGKFACEKCQSIFGSSEARRLHKLECHRNVPAVRPKGLYCICKICTCHFKWASKLLVHMKTFHRTEVSDIKPVLSNLQCHFCNSTLSTNRLYNNHILTCHANIYHSTSADLEKTSKVRCPQCDLCFSSDYSVRIHLAAKHGHLSNVEESKKLARLRNKQVESEKLTKFSKLSVKSQKSDSRDITRTRPLSKATLFKCNKCPKHFVSCIAAVLHARSCALSKKGNYKCHQCKRIFNLQDKFYHDCQHNISDKFKVIEVTRNILRRIICKCQACKVCFDEKSFMSFHSELCNAEASSVKCAECNLWVHTRAMPLHKKLHASGLTPRDFIVTEYIHVSMAVKRGEQATSRDKFKVKTIKALKIKHFSRLDKKCYYYCVTCDSYMRVNKYSDQHSVAQCTLSHKDHVTCKSCGLKFTRKCYRNHQALHKMFPHIKLDDLKFVDIQNNKRITPPPPGFMKCSKCDVAFVSKSARCNHACDADDSKVCEYCHGKFSDLAYKLHVAFHEYAARARATAQRDTSHDESETNEDIPEIIKKYESLEQVWNILYRCSTCEVVSDSYDRAVEHCQDHFCNMQSYNVQIECCNICDLNFVEDCFRRHEKLHLNDDVDRDSFTILDYKYDDLLTEAWMDTFKSLTEAQLQLILSNSMYNITRSVRMKEISPGPAELTLYRCGKCHLVVPANRVVEHSQNGTDGCGGVERYACSVCAMQFSHILHKVLHEKLHEARKLDKYSFRIIQFETGQEFSVPRVDGSTNGEEEADHASLKFIRCQHCGKLINKNKYRVHMQYHLKYNKYKKMKRDSTKVLNFYVCRECKVCVSKNNISVHICDHEAKKVKCSKCFLVFKRHSLASHLKSHERHSFGRTNIKLMYFDGTVIDRKPIRSFSNAKKGWNEQILYQCSQCSLCIWKKDGIARHVCPKPTYIFNCKICGFYFHTSRTRMHEEMHFKTDFSDVRVVKFNEKKPHSASASQKRSFTKLTVEADEATARNNKRKVDTGAEHARAKKAKTNQLPISDLVANVTNRYYKCKTCKLLFVTVMTLLDHEKSCDTDRTAKKCEGCGLVFHESTIAEHKELQECTKHTKQKVYILTIRLGREYRNPNNWIIQCVNCDTYNITVKGIRYHLRAHHHYKHATKCCVLCNVKLSSKSYTFHSKIHHGNRNLSFADLSVATVEETTLVDALGDLPCDRRNVKQSKEIKQKRFEGADVSRGDKDVEQFNVFTCDVCGLNFIVLNSLLKHKYRGLHKEQRFDCKLCGLGFTAISLKKHMNVHHNRETEKNADHTANINTTREVSEDSDSTVLNTGLREDEDVEDMEDKSTIEGSMDNNINSKVAKRTSAEASETAEPLKCDKCDLNFLTSHSLTSHMKRGNHKGLRQKCPECDLILTSKSLKIHNKIHHRLLNTIKSNDSILEISRLFDNQPHAANRDTHDGPIHDNTRAPHRRVAKNRHVKINPNLTERENDARTSGNEQVDTSEVLNTASERKDEEDGGARAELPNRNKLYKCRACDVFYLTAEDCAEHAAAHAPLDTFEYIACKICGLQFCCEFLGRHMKNHREKSFSTEDLIVAEYYPSAGGEVKVDTYLFIDRLKTTTRCDTVDSTTENVVDSLNSACGEVDSGSGA